MHDATRSTTRSRITSMKVAAAQEPWRRGLFADDLDDGEERRAPLRDTWQRAAPHTPPRPPPAETPASPQVLAAVAAAAPFATADLGTSKALRALAQALATPERAPPPPPPRRPPAVVAETPDVAAAAAKAMEARFGHHTARLMESDKARHAAEQACDRARDGEARALVELEAATRRCGAAEAKSAAAEARALALEARANDDGGDAARAALSEARAALDATRAELLRARAAPGETAAPSEAMAPPDATWTRAVDPESGCAYRYDGRGASVWEPAEPPDPPAAEGVDEAYLTADEGPQTLLAAAQVECSALQARTIELEAQIQAMHGEAAALRKDFVATAGDRDAWRGACEDARKTGRDPDSAKLRAELARARTELEKRGRELAAERCRGKAALRKRETVVKRNAELVEEVKTATRLASEAKLAARARRGFDAPDVNAARRETKEALGKAADLAREAARVASQLAAARTDAETTKAEVARLKVALAAAAEAASQLAGARTAAAAGAQEVTRLNGALAAADDALTLERSKGATALEKLKVKRRKAISNADAAHAGKAAADALAAHARHASERAKDAAHARVERAAGEFARYRLAVEARLRGDAPPPPVAFERLGSASARHLRKKRVLSPAASASSPALHPRTAVAVARRSFGR